MTGEAPSDAADGPITMTNEALFQRSCRVIPGGVNSSIRAFKAVGGTPYLVAHAEGPFIWDVEGTRYIDLVQSYGAIILGHAHPAVTAAITQAAKGGTSYGAPTPGEMLSHRNSLPHGRGCFNRRNCTEYQGRDTEKIHQEAPPPH